MTHLQFDAKEKSLFLQFCKIPEWILLWRWTVEPMKHRIFQAKSQRNKVQGSKLQRVTHWTRNRFGITYIMRSMDQVTVEYQWVMLYGRAFDFPGAAPIHRFIVRMILRKSQLTFLTPPRSLPLRPPAAHIQILNSHFSGNGVAEVLNRGSEGAKERRSVEAGFPIRWSGETWFAEAGLLVRWSRDSGFVPGSRVHVSGPPEHGIVEAGIHPGAEKGTGGAFQGGWWNQNWKYARGWMVIVVET